MRVSRHVLAGVATATVAIAAAAALLIGLTGSSPRNRAAATDVAARADAPGATVSRPAAGARAAAGAGGAATLVPDPEQAQSYPEPANAPPGPDARTPNQAAQAATVSPAAPSDAQIRAELRQMHAALAAQRAQAQQAAGAGGSVGGSGTITAPAGVPLTVAEVIAGGNAIADFPYRWGGGHASFVDDAYDCSGSVSYALAAAGLLPAPVTSGQLMTWGAPGPGRWITVYASAGHTYMYVDGVRFDTSFRSGPFGSRWQPSARTNQGFVARHWPGL